MGGVEQSGIPPPGTLLGGKYKVESVLGAGGMGVVLAARHVELGQRVALKFLNAQFADNAEVVARFLREARAAASVQSEHVARVLDVTRTAEGAPYIVMEHLAGTDLDQLLRTRGPLPVDEAIDYLLQASEAIAEAHAAGIVHRDLKPGNLFLTRRADGSSLVKVLDFGMSKVVAAEGAGEQGNLTLPAAILGSPWYMSPEQVRSSKNVDQRTDVWSLGVVLYKLLTASLPFHADSLSSGFLKIATEAPESLREKRPEVPVELEAAILRCLEKDVGRRFQNVAELAMALLPFAPERSRLSVERVARVVLGTDAFVERTMPLAPAVADAVTVKLDPQSIPAPSPPEPSTAAVATASLPAPKRAPRWRLVAALACVLLAGAALLAARRFRGSAAEPAAASAAKTSASATSVEASAPPIPVGGTPPVSAPEPPPSAAPPEPSPAATSAPKRLAPALGHEVPKPAKPVQPKPPDHPGML